MSKRSTRRSFLLGSCSALVAAPLIRRYTARAAMPSETVNVAAVGVGGKGWSDLNGAAKHARVVAFCDVETGENRKGGFAPAAEAWPDARRYTDWRKMLDKEAKNLDAVTVSTPDHMHGPITMSAIQRGLGTYTQKPMTRTIFEARQVTLAASEAGVATQMGNQHHSGTNYRTLVNLIREGAIGKVREAHAWSNRPSWPQGIDRPTGSVEFRLRRAANRNRSAGNGGRSIPRRRTAMGFKQFRVRSPGGQPVPASRVPSRLGGRRSSAIGIRHRLPVPAPSTGTGSKHVTLAPYASMEPGERWHPWENTSAELVARCY